MTARFFSYPEGETYFVRSSLKTGDFNPNADSDFYRNALIELVYNRPVWESNPPASSPHPRSKIKTISSGSTKYHVFDAVYIFYGPSPTDIKRVHKINSSVHFDHYRAFTENKDTKAGILNIPLPKESEVYMWIDNTAPIRAVYFPLVKEANIEFPHVATYLKVAFNMRSQSKIRMIRNPGPNSVVAQYAQDITLGWRYLEGTCATLRIKYRALYLLLSLAPRDRDPNKPIYSTGDLITVLDANALTYNTNLQNTTGYMATGTYMKDFRDLVSENTGITMLPPPLLDPPEFWLISLFRSIASFALGLIPYVGPLLAVAFDLGIEAIEAGQTGAKFPSDPINLAVDILGGMVSSGIDIAEYKKKKKPKSRSLGAPDQMQRLIAATAWVTQCPEYMKTHPEISKSVVAPAPLAEPEEEEEGGPENLKEILSGVSSEPAPVSK